MSNLSTSPGSRPLELLKVVELKDELRKRGLNIKGVKKELLERLEEVVKMEDQEGDGHEGHGATQESVRKTGTPNATEDVEEGVEVLDETNASNNRDMSDVNLCGKTVSSYPSDSIPSSHSIEVLPTAPLSTQSNEATPTCETLVSCGVSAPDGVPGFIEDREQLSAPGAASVGTNNDVLFVDNAVCENGNAVLLPGNVSSVAEKSETGRENSGSHESGPEIAPQELKAIDHSDGAFESGCALGVNRGIASKEMDMSMDDGGVHASADNVVLANDAKTDMQDAEMANLPAVSEVVPVQVSISKTLIEVSSEEKASPLETEHKAPSEPTLHSNLPVDNAMDKSLEEKDVGDARTQVLGEASEGMKVPIGDDRDMFVTEENPSTNMEIGTRPEEKHRVVNAGAVEKSDVQMEPTYTDAGLDDRRQVRNKGMKEMQIDEGVPSQLTSLLKESPLNDEFKVEKSSSDYPEESRGEESEDKLPGDSKSIASDNPGLEAVKDDSQGSVDLKRKGAETDSKKQEEPAKRMRRWSSIKEASVGALKPTTVDTVNKVTSPDRMQGSSVAAQRSTRKPTATSREVPPKLSPKLKVEPDNGNARTVPPSARAPSNSLKIERFVRPFTLKALKDLLGKFGQCVEFWMDQIKTHCFVTFASVNEAVAARDSLYGRQWPPLVGNVLVAEFVDASEVKMRSEGLAEKTPAAQPMGLLRNVPHPMPPWVVTQSVTPSFHSSSNALPPSRLYRERHLAPPAPRRDPEPAVLTLEDLFCKTTAKPSIYYLPLNDEQVAQKVAAAANKNKQAATR